MAFFCKICFDAKNNGYDTHNIRDRVTGRLTCKYLAGLECTYCRENGHTPSHCLKKKKDLSRCGSREGFVEWTKNEVVVSMGKIGKDIGKRDDVRKPIKKLEIFKCLEIEGEGEEQHESDEERDSDNSYDNYNDLEELPPVSVIWRAMSTSRWGD